MLDYLHGAYPKVHLTLHAGELWQGLVPPNELRDHIRKSVEIGHAERIGHGVDVMFEDDPVDLLKEMASKKIAVEINLTSNDMILGVGGNEHPLAMYLKFGVPTVISTDDDGVARSDMTHEYMKLLREHEVTYSQLKQMVRNSLEYSFLPGESLFSDYPHANRNTACAKAAPACDKFVSTSERATAQWKLEQDFEKFEAGECCKIR
jgi:adenosine deaminase